MRPWVCISMIAATLVGSSSVQAASPCNYGCEWELGGCFTCQLGSELEDCHVGCFSCWGQNCNYVAAPPGESLQPIQRIHAPRKEVLEVLGRPYRRILEAVLPVYNSERSPKRNPINISGGVVLGDDLHDPRSEFTLTVEQDVQGTQIALISVDALGAAELKLDPAAGEVSFHVTYNDGRRSISGRGALAP